VDDYQTFHANQENEKNKKTPNKKEIGMTTTINHLPISDTIAKGGLTTIFALPLEIPNELIFFDMLCDENEDENPLLWHDAMEK